MVPITGDLPLAVGSHAEVTGVQVPGAREVTASKIVVRSSLRPTWTPLEGTLIEAPRPLPATWRVRDINQQVTPIEVSEKTILQEDEGAVSVSAWVKVYGTLNVDGKVEASRIQRKSRRSP
jgi:hypothetical protein